MSRTLRLFAIRDTHTNDVLKDKFFMDKKEAHAARDALNGHKSEGNGSDLRYVVTYGPDHRKHVTTA